MDEWRRYDYDYFQSELVAAEGIHLGDWKRPQWVRFWGELLIVCLSRRVQDRIQPNRPQSARRLVRLHETDAHDG